MMLVGVPPCMLVYFGAAVDIGIYFWREVGCPRREEDLVVWKACSRQSGGLRLSERLASGDVHVTHTSYVCREGARVMDMMFVSGD